MPRVIALAAVVLAMLLASPVTSRASYVSPTNNFNIDLPDGWVQIDPVQAGPIVGRYGEDAGQHAQYEIAFIRASGRSIQLPYAAFQYIPGAVDLNDFEREADKLNAKR